MITVLAICCACFLLGVVVGSVGIFIVMKSRILVTPMPDDEHELHLELNETLDE